MKKTKSLTDFKNTLKKLQLCRSLPNISNNYEENDNMCDILKKSEDLFKVCDEEHGKLYVSDILSATNINILTKYSIKAVVNMCCVDMRGKYEKHDGIIYYDIKMRDVYDDVNEEKIRESLDFIKENIKKYNVLVHCLEGKSRSICLVTLFVVKYGNSINDTINTFINKTRENEKYVEFTKEYKQFGINNEVTNVLFYLKQMKDDINPNILLLERMQKII